MGTDLHGPLIEIGHRWHGNDNKEINWWREFAWYNWSDRNYVFFDVLAGVRGPGNNPIEVRGVPLDTHNIKKTKADYEKTYGTDEDYETQGGHWLGYHDHTWLTPDEWEQVVVAYRAKVQQYIDDGEKDGYPKDTLDIRMVDGLIKLAKQAEVDGRWGNEPERPIRLIFGFDS